jgi:NAD(P)-dependent dehydrogenase (short-subunit alcohol dehydrogenase family)
MSNCTCLLSHVEVVLMSDAGTSRAVLLTGATGGIGAATARALVERGFRVYAGARGPAGELAGARDVHVLKLDVTEPGSIAAAVEEVRALGETALHGVVNNAGIIVQGPLELVPEAELRRQFDVNVFGPALVTQAFLPLLREGEGRLVNVTAATARLAGPFFGPISASKAALASMSDSLRLELAHWGIPVVVIEPGGMETRIFAKAAEAAEQAHAAMPGERVALYRAQLEAVSAAQSRMKLSPPTLVADAIVRALTTAKPKPRYTVGPDVRLLGLLARLPLRTRDRLLRRVTGLAKVPAASK